VFGDLPGIILTRSSGPARCGSPRQNMGTKRNKRFLLHWSRPGAIWTDADPSRCDRWDQNRIPRARKMGIYHHHRNLDVVFHRPSTSDYPVQEVKNFVFTRPALCPLGALFRTGRKFRSTAKGKKGPRRSACGLFSISRSALPSSRK